MIHYGLFFATLKRRPRKNFLGGKLFLIKIENFYQKTTSLLKNSF